MFNPLNIDSVISNAGQLAYTGVKIAGKKVRDKLSENATPQNMALATLGAAAITAVMLQPAARAAICTFLGLSIQISNITLTLMMIGIYAAWMGVKGLSSFAGSASSFAKDFSNKDANPTSNAPQENAKAEPTISNDEKSKNPFVNTSLEEQVEEFNKTVLEQQPQISSNKVIAEEELTVENFEQFVQNSQQNNPLVDEFDQFLEETFENLQQPIPKTPVKAQNSDVDLDDLVNDWMKMESTTEPKPRPQTEKKLNAKLSDQLVEEFLNTKRSSLNVSKMVSEFSSQQTSNEWAKEFAMGQAKKTNNADLILGAVAVGTGVFAAYYLYKQLTRETNEPVKETSYGYVSSDQFVVEDERPSVFKPDYNLFQ